MSIYIHIPFCTNICTYCDFCKVLKNKKWIQEYLIALEKEINQNYKGELIKTIYIGGGTPSTLNIEELKQLFNILSKLNIDQTAEITFEANSEDLNIEKLTFLKSHINRLSIGVQTFNKERLNTLNRKININNIKLAFQFFDNINLDLMYGFKNQKIEELKYDLMQIIKLNPTHISTYCLILEPHTKLYIENYKPLNDDKEREMYDLIIDTLTKHNYHQYELSNFSKKYYNSKHNLVYWNNEPYYGFGLGASGYVGGIRYENTRNLNNYLKGKTIYEKHKLSLDEIIQNEFILGLRKISGINKNKFYKKYKINIMTIKPVIELIQDHILLENNTNIYLNPKYLYLSNEVLLNFIDFSLHKH